MNNYFKHLENYANEKGLEYYSSNKSNKIYSPDVTYNSTKYVVYNLSSISKNSYFVFYYSYAAKAY